jgi:hypothetical protein
MSSAVINGLLALLQWSNAPALRAGMHYCLTRKARLAVLHAQVQILLLALIILD